MGSIAISMLNAREAASRRRGDASFSNEESATDINALVNLIERGHRDSTQWAFKVASKLTDQQAIPFLKALSSFENDASPRRREAASRAFSMLIAIDPISAWELLHKAEDDSTQQEHMLYAMLQSTDANSIDDAVKQASKLKRIGVNKADVMTLLLVARSGRTITRH